MAATTRPGGVVHRPTSLGQQCQQQRRGRTDDVDRPDGLFGKFTNRSDEGENLGFIVRYLGRQQRLAVDIERGHPMVRLADVHPNPRPLPQWRHVQFPFSIRTSWHKPMDAPLTHP